MDEFIVPGEPHELWSDEGGSQLAFRVQNFTDLTQSSPEEVGEMAENVAFILCAQDALCVVEQQNFDQLCSLLAAWPLLEGSKRRQLIDSLCSSLTCLNAWIDKLLAQHAQAQQPETGRQYRSAFKAYIFLLSWVASLAGRETRAAAAAPSMSASQAGPRGRGRKKHATTAEAAGWDWETVHPKVVKAVAQALNTDLWALFRPGRPEEALMVRIMQLAVDSLELPSSAKDQDLAAQATHVLTACALRYEQLDAVTTALVDLLNKHEHTPAPVASLLRFSIEQYNDSRLATAVVGELASVDPAEYERQQTATGEKAGVRSVAAFVEEATARLPRFMAQQVSLLLPHLGGKAHSLRCAIVHAIGFLLHKVFADAVADTGDPHGAAARLHTKQHLLDVLVDRIRDTSAYVRVAVLKTWGYLADHKAIPLGHWRLVTAVAAGRLEDKSPLVRKEALRLIQGLMMNNPFGPSLPVARFHASLVTHRAMLDQVLPPSQEGGDIAEAVRLEQAQQEQQAHGAADSEAEHGEAPVKAEPEEVGQSMQVDGEQEQPQGAVEQEPPESAHRTAKSPAEVGWEGTVEELQALVASLGLAVDFAKALSGVMPILSNLLASSSVSDVQESIALLLACKQFEVDGAAETIRKMLPLIFSHDQAIKDRIVDALDQLYINGWSGNTFTSEQAAGNMIKLASGATLGELGALEEVIKHFALREFLRPPILHDLWDVADKAYTALAVRAPGVEKAHRDLRAALAVLSMVAASRPQAFNERHVRMALKFGFSSRAPDALLTRHACALLQRLEDNFDTGVFDNVQPEVYAALTQAVIASPLPNSCWYSASEAALTALYHLHPAPEHVAAAILRQLSAKAFADVAGGAGAQGEAMEGVEHGAENASAGSGSAQLACSISALGRFMFALGHVALQHLVYIERAAKLVRRQRLAAEKKAAEEQAERAQTGQSRDKEEDLNAELGVGSASADAELDVMKEESEAQILAAHSLLQPYARLVSALCHSKLLERCDRQLRGSALLALTKLMVVDPGFCDANLQLLFTMLQKEWLEPGLRSNLAIALGDLALRWPNLLEPWTQNVYRPLSDHDVGVRKNTLMVLSHLILNDMMKVKGHIAKMAVCLEDGDERIAALAKLFFSELAKKEYKGTSPIYNLLPDILSNLSKETSLSKMQFQSIMQALLGYIKKDKQGDALVDKLCQRFGATTDVRQWHNIAFCLTQLPTSDKGLRKLCDSFKLYQHALCDEEVAAAITSIVQKAKKGSNKQEVKSLVDEFEKKIVDCAAERAEEERTADAARQHTEELRAAADAATAASQQSSMDASTDQAEDGQQQQQPEQHPAASDLAAQLGTLGLEDGSNDSTRPDEAETEATDTEDQEESDADAEVVQPGAVQPSASQQSGVEIKPEPEVQQQQPQQRRHGLHRRGAAAAAVAAVPKTGGRRAARGHVMEDESGDEEEISQQSVAAPGQTSQQEQAAEDENQQQQQLAGARVGRSRVSKLAGNFEGRAPAAGKRGGSRRRAAVAESDSEGGDRISAVRGALAAVQVKDEPL